MENQNKPEDQNKTRRPARKAPVKKAASRSKATDLLRSGKEKLNQIPFEPIWNRVKKELQIAAKAIGKGTEKAAEKTVIMGKQAGLQYQIYLHQLKLQKLLAELGGRIYDLTRTDSPALTLNDPGAMATMNKIKEMDEKIAALKDKLQVLKKT